MLSGAFIFYCFQKINKQEKIDREKSISQSNAVKSENNLSLAEEKNSEPLIEIPSGKIVLYYSNSKKNPQAECGQVFPVFRNSNEKENDPAYILKELFSGPSKKEKEEGYYSEFSSDSEGLLKKVSIKNQVAAIDLNDKLASMENVTTSCGSLEFFSQVKETLKSNLKVEKVVFAINGDPEKFYTYWMQMSCPNEDIEDCTKQGFKNLAK